MNVYLNSVDGIGDAMVALTMSKRHWSPEKDKEIRDKASLSELKPFDEDDYEFLKPLIKWGPKHTTLLSFIDISVTVEGLHRAGQDDWDSHAKRFNNRIIRSSTRLAKYGNEKSDFYKDKIMTLDDLIELGLISVPDTIGRNGITYHKVTNGYVREDCVKNKDALRGLYPLGIPSNFIFKCDLYNFAHVVKQRDKNSNANPEVKELTEKILELLEEKYPFMTREWLYSIEA